MTKSQFVSKWNWGVYVCPRFKIPNNDFFKVIKYKIISNLIHKRGKSLMKKVEY